MHFSNTLTRDDGSHTCSGCGTPTLAMISLLFFTSSGGACSPMLSSSSLLFRCSNSHVGYFSVKNAGTMNEPANPAQKYHGKGCITAFLFKHELICAQFAQSWLLGQIGLSIECILAHALCNLVEPHILDAIVTRVMMMCECLWCDDETSTRVPRNFYALFLHRWRIYTSCSAENTSHPQPSLSSSHQHHQCPLSP